MAEGKPTLLLTRPRRESEKFYLLCSPRMPSLPELVISPAFEVEPINVDIELDKYSTLIFTSANAVRILADTYELHERVAICVGDKTAATAAMRGMRAISADGTAEDLIQLITDIRPNPPLLHVRGERARGDIDIRLTEAGLTTEVAIVYSQSAKPLSGAARTALAGDTAIVLPVFSPRSAELICRQIPDQAAPLHVVAMSDAVEAAWTAPRASMTVATTPDARAMAEAVASFFPV